MTRHLCNGLQFAEHALNSQSSRLEYHTLTAATLFCHNTQISSSIGISLDLGRSSSCTLCNCFHQCCLCYTKFNAWQIKDKLSDIKSLQEIVEQRLTVFLQMDMTKSAGKVKKVMLSLCITLRYMGKWWYFNILKFELGGGVWSASCPAFYMHNPPAPRKQSMQPLQTTNFYEDQTNILNVLFFTSCDALTAALPSMY